jgi:hypothetical protein
MTLQGGPWLRLTHLLRKVYFLVLMLPTGHSLTWQGYTGWERNGQAGCTSLMPSACWVRLRQQQAAALEALVVNNPSRCCFPGLEPVSEPV